ncbi:MAG TPA: RHS repeat-associated core domain-containing protein [Candidatus Kapabacteria bacterium]|nr:RHS repeat-associated core domain-containing protein [Candidatus Kapabacteria bacterium]
MNRYRKGEVFASDTCDISQILLTDVEWQYRYNPFGERESKYMTVNSLDERKLRPMEYYLLGPGNEQFAVYNGFSIADTMTIFLKYQNSWYPIYFPADSTQKFVYPTEYNVYSGEGVLSSYRLAYGVAQKNYFIYNHLGSKAVEVDSVGNIIDYVLYSPFGEPLKKNSYQPQWNERLGYIDKEKDRESKLGDHTSTLLSAGGVRKYDYEIGRFTSVDPLWEKYTGWTGYHYTRNNPINRIDFSGLDDGQFGSWMQVGPIQELILGDKNVNTYQEIIENSDKPANKQLINAWAQIGLMGLTGVATDVALSSPFAAKYLSKASHYIKGLLGFGDDAVNLGFKVEGQLNQIFQDKKLFVNWLKGNQSLTRQSNPLNKLEAQQIIDNAKKLGLNLEGNLKGLQGLEITGQWGGIPHFKVGNVHIPIGKGLEGVLKF